MKNSKIENRKAYHDYFITETLTCGIELRGNEVKSVVNGMCNIKDSYAEIKDKELWLHGMHVSKWETTNAFDVDENRPKKLLAHKREIIALSEKVKRDGMTLVPVNIHSECGKLKVDLALCKGKHNYDKRASKKERDIKRELERNR